MYTQIKHYICSTGSCTIWSGLYCIHSWCGQGKYNHCWLYVDRNYSVTMFYTTNHLSM